MNTPERLPVSWISLDDAPEQRKRLGAELVREVRSAQHPLYGREAEAVAHRRCCDDVLFWLPEQSQWALIHLTWQQEANPSWPSCEIFPTWAEAARAASDEHH